MAIAALQGWTSEQKHVVAASFLGWTLDAFDFFLLVFVLKDIAQEFGTQISSVTFAILLTLAMRPIGAFIFGRFADRFGLSDAADMFVFLSGMAASIAFGGAFLRHGFLIGTARIVFRCWQLFVAHLGLFFTGAAVIVAGTRWFGDIDYVAVMQLKSFFSDTGTTLIGLFTLSYVPPNFDILPLYIAVLAMVPAMMLLSRLHPRLVPAVSILIYAIATGFGVDFATHSGERQVWFFNPLAWQLIFFTGFCLRRGWVRVPLESRLLFWGSIGLIVVGVLISLQFILDRVPPIALLRDWIVAHSDKTNLDLMRYAHFLALAYVAVVLLKGREAILLSRPLKPFVKCGQQALSIFIASTLLAIVATMIFDHAGTGLSVQIAVNGVCFALMLAVAYTVAWFKSAPWKRRPAEPETARAELPVRRGIGPARPVSQP